MTGLLGFQFFMCPFPFLTMEGLTLVASSGEEHVRDLLDVFTADTQPIFPFFDSFPVYHWLCFWRITPIYLLNFFSPINVTSLYPLDCFVVWLFYTTSDTTHDQ
jgi:hypothetical protein